jgi:hypothetical protein
MINVAPCGWTVETCGCGSCWDSYAPAVRDRAEALAATVMWAATGRRYGPCEVTILPCNARRELPLYQAFSVVDPLGIDSVSGGFAGPVLDDGQWFNRCSVTGCSCRARCEVPLPGPVAAVVEVTVEGDVVTPSAYQVQADSTGGELLVRVDGDCWPTCQIYGTEIPGFTVTYTRGLAIPAAVQSGFEVLACEYAKACTGAACALPPRLQSLTRQGVEVTVAEIPTEPGGLIRTGIKVVDDIIQAVNPYGLAAAAEVLSPDQPRFRTITFQGGS